MHQKEGFCKNTTLNTNLSLTCLMLQNRVKLLLIHESLTGKKTKNKKQIHKKTMNVIEDELAVSN